MSSQDLFPIAPGQRHLVGTATYQSQSSLQSLLVSQELSLLHAVGFPAQDFGVGLEFPEAVDGLNQ